MLREEAINHSLLDRFYRDVAQEINGQVRDDYPHSALASTDIEAHWTIAEDRFFDEEDAPLLREATQKMLRSLINEVPAKMRQTDKIRRIPR
jgi:hypothetical protein